MFAKHHAPGHPLSMIKTTGKNEGEGHKIILLCMVGKAFQDHLQKEHYTTNTHTKYEEHIFKNVKVMMIFNVLEKRSKVKAEVTRSKFLALFNRTQDKEHTC